jgi:hypothetical protein
MLDVRSGATGLNGVFVGDTTNGWLITEKSDASIALRITAGGVVSTADRFTCGNGGTEGCDAPTGFKIGSGQRISKYMSATASLDFAAWAGSGDCQTLNITVAGAVANDTVTMGLPAALGSLTDIVWSQPWVNSANTIGVKGCKPSAGASSNPAAATVRVDVWQH